MTDIYAFYVIHYIVVSIPIRSVR